MLRDFFQKINTTLAKFPYKRDEIEIEVRYRLPGDGKKSNVPKIYFQRLTQWLQEQKYQYITEESTVKINGDFRKIILTKKEPEKDQIIWQRKNLLDFLDFPDYGVKLSLSREYLLRPEEQPKFFEAKIQRDRSRYRYRYGDLAFVDLTEVLTWHDNKQYTNYEVEIEFLQSKEGLIEFEELIWKIWKVMRVSENIYTENVRRKMIDDANKWLNVKDFKKNLNPQLAKDFLVKARNLRQTDIVYGGIVGNAQTAYSVTFKADGLRKMLIIHQTGIWLVYPPMEYNLVIANDMNYKEILKVFHGLIYDGELVTTYINEHYLSETQVKAKYRYLAFDCLTYQGNREISELPFIQREKVIKHLAKIFHNNILSIEAKKNYLLTLDNFFTTMQQIFVEKDKLTYREDGLIFTPIDIAYEINNENIPNRKRVLTNIPDVCKWKESKNLTIDFKIKWTGQGKLQIFTWDSRKRQEIIFPGSLRKPFLPEMLQSDHMLLQGQPSGTIIEFEWHSETEELVPRLIREDKMTSNTLEVAQQVWDDIFDPLLRKTLEGSNLKLVYQYHNRIKSNLYQELDFTRQILDIGSGRGGDIKKWLTLPNETQIIAVEPSLEHQEELKRRLSEFPKLQPRVDILEAYGQDYDLIHEFLGSQKVDAVTLMLSLSFFWYDEIDLYYLARVITDHLSNQGLIIFLTIDGVAVNKLFRQFDKRVINLQEATLSLDDNVDLEMYDYGQKLHINIPGTIVGEQEEYLVYLDFLSEMLDIKDWKLTKYESADKELLLPPQAAIFSSLYSYGIYQKQNKQIYDDLPVIEDKTSAYEYWENIKDNNSLLHAVLQGYYQPYRQAKKQEKIAMANELREEIVINLDKSDPYLEDYCMWETANEGQYVINFLVQILEEKYVNDSVENIQKLLLMQKNFSEKLLSFVSVFINLNIVIIDYNFKILQYARTFQDKTLILQRDKQNYLNVIPADRDSSYFFPDDLLLEIWNQENKPYNPEEKIMFGIQEIERKYEIKQLRALYNKLNYSRLPCLIHVAELMKLYIPKLVIERGKKQENAIMH